MTEGRTVVSPSSSPVPRASAAPNGPLCTEVLKKTLCVDREQQLAALHKHFHQGAIVEHPLFRAVGMAEIEAYFAIYPTVFQDMQVTINHVAETTCSRSAVVYIDGHLHARLKGPWWATPLLWLGGDAVSHRLLVRYVVDPLQQIELQEIIMDWRSECSSRPYLGVLYDSVRRGMVQLAQAVIASRAMLAMAAATVTGSSGFSSQSKPAQTVGSSSIGGTNGPGGGSRAGVGGESPPMGLLDSIDEELLLLHRPGQAVHGAAGHHVAAVAGGPAPEAALTRRGSQLVHSGELEAYHLALEDRPAPHVPGVDTAASPVASPAPTAPSPPDSY